MSTVAAVAASNNAPTTATYRKSLSCKFIYLFVVHFFHRKKEIIANRKVDLHCAIVPRNFGGGFTSNLRLSSNNTFLSPSFFGIESYFICVMIIYLFLDDVVVGTGRPSICAAIGLFSPFHSTQYKSCLHTLTSILTKFSSRRMCAPDICASLLLVSIQSEPSIALCFSWMSFYLKYFVHKQKCANALAVHF